MPLTGPHVRRRAADPSARHPRHSLPITTSRFPCRRTPRDPSLRFGGRRVVLFEPLHPVLDVSVQVAAPPVAPVVSRELDLRPDLVQILLRLLRHPVRTDA